MAFIAPFHFPPLNTSCERASVIGTAVEVCFEACGPMQKTRGLGTTKIAKARGSGRASVYRSWKPTVDTGSPGNRASFVRCGMDETIDALGPDVPAEDARSAFNSRLEALAHAHDILFRSNWARANLGTIIDGILAPYARRGRNRIRAKGPDVSLAAKPALALGLALHEVGTNAAKYGALSNDEGCIEIAWTVAPHAQGREFRLRWRERNGPPVLPPSRTGFGTRLIQRNLAAEFDGEVELEYQPNGVECTICAPAEGQELEHRFKIVQRHAAGRGPRR
jgi:two-component sensor histidine kinase